jgi:hypothetical protein
MAVELWLRDSRSRITHTRSRCLDISEMGARILYPELVVLPAIIQIRPESDGILRTGRVRHCTARGVEYEIGIEFCDAAVLQAGAVVANKP